MDLGGLLQKAVTVLAVSTLGGGGGDEVWDRETMFSQLAKRSPHVVVSG